MSQSYAKSPAAERKFTTREMVLVGMFAAVLAVISQISLPILPVYRHHSGIWCSTCRRQYLVPGLELQQHWFTFC